jgi:hypothetical protein
MTNKSKVYTKIMQKLKKMMPQTPQNQIVTTAMMVTGIVLGRKAQLSAMSLEVAHPAKPASLEKRMQRFVKNERFEVEINYVPFAELILHHMSDKPLLLAIDGSNVGRGCMAIVVGVIYKQRAIPLAWLVYKGKKGHTTADRHIAVLQKVLPLIPSNAQVVLLGDGEYDNTELLAWVSDHTDWEFVVRTAKNILITHNGIQYPLRDLCAEQGTCTAAHDALFTAAEFGPVLAIAWWGQAYKDPICLVSNCASFTLACRYYRRRFRLETLFSDKKSRGFHIEKSHLADPARLSRLLLATSLAYIWLIHLGMMVFQDESKRSLIDRTHRTDKSLFRLGLDWVKYSMTHGLDILVAFHLLRQPVQFLGVQ